MSEEKKPTETEIIREQVAKAQKWCANSVPQTNHDQDALNALAAMLKAISEANEARDKARKLAIDVTTYDLTEPLVRALLSQGFEVALAAVVPQLKTVKSDGRITSWTPPVNPFSSGATGASADPEPAT